MQDNFLIPVAIIPVIILQRTQLTEPLFDFHFPHDFRITGSNSLDLRIVQRSVVYILCLAYSIIAMIYLRNKPLFRFKYLIRI